jgi:4-carboxymuconolactone decarboxylase
MGLSTPRVAPSDSSQWDDETRALLEATQSAPGRPILNIFATLAHYPKLLKRWLVFGNHVLFKSRIAARERELLILRTGWLCRAEYEWGQHVAIGKEAGLTDEEIHAIAIGPDAPSWNALDASLLRAADDLHREQCLSDATWQALSADLDLKQMMDVIFTVGQYTLVSMALNSLGVQREPGVASFPQVTSGASHGARR